MGSIRIDRKEYPGRSDAEIAKMLAKKNAYIVVLRYKNSASASEFTDFGLCQSDNDDTLILEQSILL